ncbi:CHAT domain-containing protein [Magnetovirga frankeli]|uniref:CHAT domain-containing protein n=1 Tax=Magnetovirga frankeli TaxID=947516 RepID=UPI003D336260
MPDTADELMAIAEVLGTDRHQALLLREKATETELKRRQLAQYNILSFATHGVLAGELGKGIEPGLILSPPKQATEEDDGFLSLSEIAQLKLNADWVVLSACNTAGSEGDEGMASEGFTGLAKSFIYAGAKALLVSHWSVSSAATVELMSTMFRSFKEQQLPRAEAHRQAMLAMIDSGDPLLSHPSLWAPFVVVGDGG